MVQKEWNLMFALNYPPQFWHRQIGLLLTLIKAVEMWLFFCWCLQTYLCNPPFLSLSQNVYASLSKFTVISPQFLSLTLMPTLSLDLYFSPSCSICLFSLFHFTHIFCFWIFLVHTYTCWIWDNVDTKMSTKYWMISV